VESIKISLYFLMWILAVSGVVTLARYLIDKYLSEFYQGFFDKMRHHFLASQRMIEKGKSGMERDGTAREGKKDLV